MNLHETTSPRKSNQAAWFISVNIWLTASNTSLLLSSCDASRLREARCQRQVLVPPISWFAPAPGEPRPEGRRAAAPNGPVRRPSANLQGADPTLPLGPRLPCNRRAIFFFSRVRAASRGRNIHWARCEWLLSLASEEPPQRGFAPKPLYEAPFPAGPRPFCGVVSLTTGSCRSGCRTFAPCRRELCRSIGH